MPQDLLKIYDGRTSFWQWDTGQKLIVLDRTIDQVHFTNSNLNTAIVKEVYIDENGLRLCDVPDAILKMPKPLIAYAYIMGENSNNTMCAIKFSVSARPVPEDYTYEENNRFKDLVDKIEAVQDILENGTSVKKFNSLVEANAWAQEYQATGIIMSVWNGTEWALYMTDRDYSLYQIGDTDQLIIDVEMLKNLVGESTVQEQIRVAILSLDLPHTYEKLGAADAVRNELIDETKRAQNEEAAITREIHKIHDNISKLQGNIQANYEDTGDAIDVLDKKIKANSDAIDLLANGVSAEKIDSVNDLIQYVDEHGAEFVGIKNDIKDNVAAIAAERSRAEGVETELNKKITDAASKIGGMVSYDKQTLTEEQQAQARANIGALHRSELDNIGGLVVATDDEVIEMLVEADVLMAVTDSDGSFLSDENNNILLW